MPQPFRVVFAAGEVADLKRRLAAARLPAAPAEAGWRYGIEPGYLARLLAHWRDAFDFQAAEDRLNRHAQYVAEVPDDDGRPLRLHFIREPGSGPSPRPLLLTHGWPGSVAEFVEVVAPLAHPERFGGDAADGFEVIAPSLPGYGFSQAPAAPIGPRAIARLWHRLLADVLAHPRYLAQGGDWGAMVTAWLALDRPEAVVAAHFNMTPLRPAGRNFEPPLDAAEEAWLKAARGRMARESAYQQVHATKSQTLAAALEDSPAGLAAWIVEKFHGWSGPARAEPPFAMDALLTNLTVYWLTRSINTSMWLYRGVREEGSLSLPEGRRIEVPCGFLLPEHDLSPAPPDRWLRRLCNLTHRRDLADAGHFTAMQAPGPFVADVRAFFRPYRP